MTYALILYHAFFYVSQAGVVLYFAYYSNRPKWIHINLIFVNSVSRRGLFSYSWKKKIMAQRQRLTTVRSSVKSKQNKLEEEKTKAVAL